MNIIAYYLPQFHRVKENDEWWGEGFTEWTNVKKSVPLFKGHNQPRVPLNNNYYDLTNIETLKWQGELAKKYGISFCVYHYWFNGHLLLEKPMELILKNKDVYFPFCFSWANENWTNDWEGKDSKILMSNDFENEEDWDAHFNYLLPFFKDRRYLKENGNPIFVLYRPQMFKQINKFIDRWNHLARENGFEKIVFIFQSISLIKEKPAYMQYFDYGLEFQPGYNEYINNKKTYGIDKVRDNVAIFLQKKFGIYFSVTNLVTKLSKKNIKEKYSYAKMNQDILCNTPLNNKMIPGAMKDWDNTPRYGRKGKVYIGSTPDLFAEFLEKQIIRAKKIYKKNAIFVFAWNEWGEGGYLEPDTTYGNEYLEKILKVLDKMGEFEIPDPDNDSNIRIGL